MNKFKNLNQNQNNEITSQKTIEFLLKNLTLFSSTTTPSTLLLISAQNLTAINSTKPSNNQDNGLSLFDDENDNNAAAISIENENDIIHNWSNSTSIIILVIIYSVIIFSGIISNTFLIIALCSPQSSIRFRNPLLVTLCLADLFVVGISAPSTIAILAFSQKSWNIESIGCKIVYFLQSAPVAASTISFLILSLNRFVSVTHPPLSHVRQRQYVQKILAILPWIAALIICIPILFAYNISIQSVFTTKSSQLYNRYITCRPHYGSAQIQMSYVITHTILVFILPGSGVVLSHYGVRKKLCALSLMARAAHGELPLPMPILKQPTHMIIVTGMANTAAATARNVVHDIPKNEKSSDDPNKVETIIISNLNSSRTKRKIDKKLRKHQRNTENTSNIHPSSELPLSRTSTLKARRKLANMLVGAAIIFVICWTPHVFCILYAEISQKDFCSPLISYLSLLLGYLHSAINPFLYWTLNHKTLNQSTRASHFRFNNIIQRLFRTRIQSPIAQRAPPSSTNEAALGAFNPRYIKPSPKQYRLQASSHYFY